MNSRLVAQDPEYQSLAALVLDQFGELPSLNISAQDGMYSYAETVCGSRTLGLMSYFRSGIQIGDAVRQLVDWHFTSRAKAIRLLDFAAGYGRSTRFLAADFGPENLWTSDLLSDALEFQSSEFDVQTVLSAAKPEAFKPDLQWDCIFVNSFFDRLTEVEFTRWLWKFHSLLAPGGLLIFTACYGASALSLGFVHQAIIAAAGSLEHVHISQGLCFTHDLFAIAKGPLRTEPIPFQYGPNGCVDSCRWTEPYQMKLTGWAFDPTPGESIASVDVFYNNQLRGSCKINHNRPDIAATLGKPENEAAIYSGWDCIADLDGESIRPTQDWIKVKAVSTSGREFVLRLDHPSAIGEFDSVPGWEYDETKGRSHAILPVVRFVDLPPNGHFTSEDTTFAGWVATEEASNLEQVSLVGRFGTIPYTIVQRPDVYADHYMPCLGFETTLPSEYLTTSDPRLRFVTPSGVVLTTLETVVDFPTGN